MNAVIDLGNTFGKIGWFDGPELVEVRRRIPLQEVREAIETRFPMQAILSSTSQDTQPLADWLTVRNCLTFQLHPGLPIPIGKDYDTPQTLGADRLAAAVGAAVQFPNENCVVIDMGTCVTYDWVSADGIFHGGLIAPGLRMRLQAMHTFTKRLPLVEIEDFPPFIGKSTKQAMASGAINGMLAEINGIVARYQSDFGDCRVLVCGGDAPFFESRLKSSIFAAPNIVLIGLNRILLHNVLLQRS